MDTVCKKILLLSEGLYLHHDIEFSSAMTKFVYNKISSYGVLLKIVDHLWYTYYKCQHTFFNTTFDTFNERVNIHCSI